MVKLNCQLKLNTSEPLAGPAGGQYFFKISFNDEIKLPKKITLEFIIYIDRRILDVIFWESRDKTLIFNSCIKIQKRFWKFDTFADFLISIEFEQKILKFDFVRFDIFGKSFADF